MRDETLQEHLGSQVHIGSSLKFSILSQKT